MALAVPLSRFTSQVGGGSAFYVRRLRAILLMKKKPKTKAVREHTAKAKLHKVWLSQASPKVHLKAGGIIECEFPVEKRK